jgi:hypothetical protein
MIDAPRTCPDCAASYEPADNYCRQCGMYLAALRDTAIIAAAAAPPARVDRPRAQLPAPVKKAATAVAIGTALQIGVGLTGKYLARQATRQAVSAVRPKPGRREKVKPLAETAPVVQSATPDPYGDAAAVSETVMIRRVWIRRNP